MNGRQGDRAIGALLDLVGDRDTVGVWRGAQYGQQDEQLEIAQQWRLRIR